jgi:hypothetical protein
VGAGVFAAVVLLWCLVFSTGRFSNPDAHDYAQMGRELRQGHGFATKQVFARHIPKLKREGLLDAAHWPNLYRYPLPVLGSALVQLFVEDETTAAVVLSGIGFLLCVPLLFYLVTRFADPLIAALAVLLFVADGLVFEHAYNGMTESLAIMLALGLFCVLFAPGRSRYRWLAAGAICGLAVLTRTQMVVLLPIAVVQAFLETEGRARASAVGLVLGGFVLLLAPWMVRNLIVVGEPFFSFSATRNIVRNRFGMGTDIDMHLDAPVALGEVLRVHGGEVARRYWDNLWVGFVSPRFWGKMLDGVPPLLVFACAVPFVHPAARRQPSTSRIAAAALCLFVINFALVCLVYHLPRFYIIVHPFAIMLGVYGLVLAKDAFPERLRAGARWCLVGLVLTLGVLQLWATVGHHLKQKELETRASRKCWAEIRARTPRDALIATDKSGRMTLHAHRRTLRLPARPEDLLAIDDEYVRIDYVALSARPLRKRKAGRYRGSGYWRFVKDPDFKERFERVRRLPGGIILYEHR